MDAAIYFWHVFSTFFFYIKENDMLKYSFYYYNSMSQIIVAFHTLNSLDTIDA